MSEIIELKISGWSYNGFKTPNIKVKIEDPNGKRAFTLFQMLSGEGKTTTLNLLRYSFYDVNKHLTKGEINNIISSYRPDDITINKGIFQVRFVLNNNINYRINLKFDYQSNEISYSTVQGDGDGILPGLILPENLQQFITPEFINKTFFDLELADDLYNAQSQETDKTIKKLSKLDYLDKITKNFESYKQEYIKTKIKVKDSDLSGKIRDKEILTKKLEKLKIKADNKKREKNNIIKEITEIDSIIKKISLENKDIKNKVKDAKNNLEEKNEKLRDAFYNSYNFIKNPMSINNKIRTELFEFENNLTKKRIPKAVGESFFEDLRDSESCLCGHSMTEEMKKKIWENKNLFLEDDILNILNPIKSSIKKFDNNENLDSSKCFDSLIIYEREARMAKNAFEQANQNTDDEYFNAQSKKLANLERDLKELNHWIDEVYNKPYSVHEPHDTDNIKTIQHRLEKLEKEIDEKADVVDLSKKIKILTEMIKDIQKTSLERISNLIIQNINKEVKRVMPLEEIYVESIKNKITLKTKDGITRSGNGGASRGQMVRIAYLFLITLLDRPHLKFPLIVDSPVTALDTIGRTEIAKSRAKDFSGQYIGFIFDTERADFSNILEKELNNEINLITAFSKSEASSHMIKLAEEHDVNTNEFENGVVGYNKDFFNKFKGANENN